jgi:hypothetical protein
MRRIGTALVLPDASVGLLNGQNPVVSSGLGWSGQINRSQALAGSEDFQCPGQHLIRLDALETDVITVARRFSVVVSAEAG